MPVSVVAHTVRIHIDRDALESPDPTTGKALYQLANIPKRRTLFRERKGNHEDEAVARDDTVIDLKKDDRFYSQQVFDLLVNGEDHEIDTKAISYARVLEFYLGQGGTPSNEYLIKYSHGPAENPSGTLAPGQKVKVKDGMRFRVAGTGES